MNRDQPASGNQCLAELLTVLDEFLRYQDLLVSELLTEFLAARGSKHPGFDSCNLIDNLCFTAYRYRQLDENSRL
jgi:hypothetical protein